jgi:hypothetical protein
MRKILAFVVLSLFTFGCKSNSATNTKVDNKSEVMMKGEWTLTEVKYTGSDVIKVTSFDLADSKCFEGSTWKLISNNNKGTMSLNSPKCTAYSTPITWFVNKEGEFVLKILDDAKAKTVKSGYVLKVENQSEFAFQLVDKINVAGKMTNVVYQFKKTN